MTQDWTPLPPKWTPSTILKLHDKLLSKFLIQMLYYSDHIPKEEKNRRIDVFVEWTQMIYKYTVSGQMSYKKS